MTGNAPKQVSEEKQRNLVITSREFAEIKFAMLYEEKFAHGTDGHGRLILLAKFARHLGFAPEENGTDFVVPAGIFVRDR